MGSRSTKDVDREEDVGNLSIGNQVHREWRSVNKKMVVKPKKMVVKPNLVTVNLENPQKIENGWRIEEMSIG